MVSCISNRSADALNSITFNPLEEDEKIEVLIDGQLFTSYFYGEEAAKPVLYPILSSEGNFLTRGFPFDPRPGERVDHPHHLGNWFNYGDVNGWDFWNNGKGISEPQDENFGHIVHAGITKMLSGEHQGILAVSSLWKTHDMQVLLAENTEFVFHAKGTTRIIDRYSTLTAVNDDVILRDNKEGMFALRVARELELPTDKVAVFLDSHGVPTRIEKADNLGVSGSYLSSEGAVDDAVWGTRASWVMLSGVVNEEKVSIIIIDHPDNVGYPTYWHARGYGLFAANPLGQAIFSDGEKVLNYTLKASESVTFKYRLVILSGDLPTAEAVNSLALEFYPL